MSRSPASQSLPAKQPAKQPANAAAPAAASSGGWHVVWVNQHAAPVGGCEHYVLRTAKLLAAEGVRNTLLYEVGGQLDKTFVDVFDGAFPLVEPQRQLEQLGADLAYVHRLSNQSLAPPLASSSIPCLRFYHDHQLFCLREHKYTAIGSSTCERTTGLGCYLCLGFVQRSDTWPGLAIRTLCDLKRDQEANLEWDGHVVGSEYMSRHLQAHGFSASRIHTLPLFVDELDDADAQDLPPRRDDLVVFAGQLVRGKGIDLLLRAMTKLPVNVRLAIAGEGRQRGELETLADDLGLADRVRFMGRLGERELRHLFCEAAVAALPSRSPETFGLAGLEASRCGAPVVAADVGGISQWLRHGKNGLLFPSGDVAQLADSLRRVLDNRALAAAMGQAARRICVEEFCSQRHVKRLMKLFRLCVKGEFS